MVTAVGKTGTCNPFSTFAGDTPVDPNGGFPTRLGICGKLDPFAAWLGRSGDWAVVPFPPDVGREESPAVGGAVLADASFS